MMNMKTIMFLICSRLFIIIIIIYQIIVQFIAPLVVLFPYPQHSTTDIPVVEEEAAENHDHLRCVFKDRSSTYSGH